MYHRYFVLDFFINSTVILFVIGDISFDNYPSSCNNMAFDLLKGPLKSKGRNVLFSPHNLCTTMDLLLIAARGNTKKQLLKICHLGLPPRQFYDDFNPFKDHIKNSKVNSGIILNSENAIFLNNNIAVKETYERVLKTQFKAEVKRLNFRTQNSEDIINKWASNQDPRETHKAFSRNSIPTDTSMILMNVLYFKGKWEVGFNEESVHQENFYINPRRPVSVEMMAIDGYFEYAYVKKLRSQIIEIPLTGNHLSMIIILPSSQFFLSGVLRKLTHEELNNSLSQLRTMEVNLKIPKFKLQKHQTLNNAFKNLGVTDLFTSKADLSGISRMPLHLSILEHDVFIEVNEEGTTAMTSARFSLRSMLSPAIFKANRPFYFAVMETKQKHLLLNGIIFNPKLNH